MVISDSVLRGRLPRVGTITTGRGVEATSKKGGTYSKPRRESTLTFHTDDPELANAVQVKLGGSVYQDSPSWGYDVVTDAAEAEVHVLVAGFRQWLTLWRAAECVRRCDGERMTTWEGRPTNRSCVCEAEMAEGKDRTCSPETVLPVLVDLDVERWGVWEVRSTAWGTAASLKGTVKMLEEMGVVAGDVPGVLAVALKKVKADDGKIYDVPELSLSVRASGERLLALGAGGQPSPDDRARAVLVEVWDTLRSRADRLGILDRLRAVYTERFPDRRFEDLSVGELRGWLDEVRGVVDAADRDATAEHEARTANREAAVNGPEEQSPSGEEPCPECDGTGRLGDVNCEACLGWGQVQTATA